MIINLKKDEAEYLLRVIDLGETFVQTHQWAYDPKWRKLKFDQKGLVETLKSIAKKKDDNFKTRWDTLKERYGTSLFEFCKYDLKSFMEKIEKEIKE